MSNVYKTGGILVVYKECGRVWGLSQINPCYIIIFEEIPVDIIAIMWYFLCIIPKLLQEYLPVFL